MVPLAVNLFHLTDLTLIGFNLMPTLARPVCLPTVTSLTVCLHRSLDLLSTFPGDATQGARIHYSVVAFRRALFAQFPAVLSLTLVGNVRRHEAVCEALRAELAPPRLARLSLFIEEYIKRRPAHRGSDHPNAEPERQMARKVEAIPTPIEHQPWFVQYRSSKR